MWQQQMQMMQSFHNDMVMMFQMFVAMHREHLGSVRDELDRVQQLTRELTRLNARLGQLPGSAETSPPSDAGGQREEARAIPQVGSPRPEGGPRPPRQTGKRTERKPSGNADRKPGATSHSAPVAKEPGKSRTTPPPPMSAAETYADLTRRITEIQKERQGYWQSILKAINK